MHYFLPFLANCTLQEEAEGGGFKVSVEIEKINMGYESLIELADVVFIGKDVSKANGAENMNEALELFKSRMMKKRAKISSILICPWGDCGAAGMDPDGKIYIAQAVPPPDDKIIDTCGAGDTFTATAIACLHKGYDLQKTLNVACLIAGIKIGQRGYKNLGREFHQKQDGQ